MLIINYIILSEHYINTVNIIYRSRNLFFSLFDARCFYEVSRSSTRCAEITNPRSFIATVASS